MKEYVNQIYNEGLGLVIYKPVEKKIEKIANAKTKKIVGMVYKMLYFVFAIVISIGLFLATYPL